MVVAPYDEIAAWYEEEFLGARSDNVRRGIDGTLERLLGRGNGACLDLGCGTGAYAGLLTRLGWTPIGTDLSEGMLAYARGRLPIARADAGMLPVRDQAVGMALSMMIHTDIPDFAAVVREAARVLRPGGALVHVGVHPCFCGGFADRSDPEAIVLRRGYLDDHWTKASYTSEGVRARIGATHRPLPELLETFLDAGLRLERFDEGGSPTPMVLGIRACRPVSPD